MPSYLMTDEIRKKISDATKKAMANPELRLSLSQKKREYYTKEGSLAKCSEIQKKRFADPEQRRLLSERGKIYSNLKIGHTEPTKGKTFVEIYGEERANEVYNKVCVLPRNRRSEIMKKKWEDPEFVNRVTTGIREWWKTPEAQIHKIKISGIAKDTNKRVRSNPDNVYTSQEYRKKCGDASRIKWKNKEYVQKLMKSAHRKPNKKEVILLDLLNEISPNLYDFNGDARYGVVVDGKVPDYINLKGRNQVIELFGDWWHGKKRTGKEPQESELILRNIYENNGYKCLIIWEKELGDKETLTNKLIEYICE